MRESKLVASRITDERIEFRQIWWLSRGKRVTPHNQLGVIATSMALAPSRMDVSSGKSTSSPFDSGDTLKYDMGTITECNDAK